MRNQYKILSEKYMNEVVAPANEKDVNPAELAKGIKVEMEHTKNPEEAKRLQAKLYEYVRANKKIKGAVFTGSDKTSDFEVQIP